MQQQRQVSAPQPREPRPYQAPAVQDLGAWKTLTLIYTLPIGPGNQGNAMGSGYEW